MNRIRNPTHTENYINLSRAVILDVITKSLKGDKDLRHYILYSADFMFWLCCADWLQYEEVIKDRFKHFHGIDRTLQKKLNTYYRLKGEEMKARKKHESNTDSRYFEQCTKGNNRRGSPDN